MEWNYPGLAVAELHRRPWIEKSWIKAPKNMWRRKHKSDLLEYSFCLVLIPYHNQFVRRELDLPAGAYEKLKATRLWDRLYFNSPSFSFIMPSESTILIVLQSADRGLSMGILTL